MVAQPDTRRVDLVRTREALGVDVRGAGERDHGLALPDGDAAQLDVAQGDPRQLDAAVDAEGLLEEFAELLRAARTELVVRLGPRDERVERVPQRRARRG